MKATGRGLLGAVLGGVHDEDAVGPEFEYGRTAGRFVRGGAALAQDELAALGVAACHLDVLHGPTVGKACPARGLGAAV